MCHKGVPPQNAVSRAATPRTLEDWEISSLLPRRGRPEGPLRVQSFLSGLRLLRVPGLQHVSNPIICHSRGGEARTPLSCGA